MSIKVKTKGNFNNTETFLISHRTSLFTDEDLFIIAEYGLQKFKDNTPSKSGKTSESWSYEIINTKKGRAIDYKNSNIQNGLNIAILVDTGHATAQGKWVSGTHYIDETIDDICSYIDKKK